MSFLHDLSMSLLDVTTLLPFITLCLQGTHHGPDLFLENEGLNSAANIEHCNVVEDIPRLRNNTKSNIATCELVLGDFRSL